MSSHTFAISDFGVVVKFEELDLENVKSMFESKGAIFDDKEDLEEQIKDLLREDCEIMLGKEYTDGCFCYKDTYGNNIGGDFRHILIYTDDALDDDVNVSLDDWVMMCLPKYPSLYKKQYKGKEDLIKSVKKLYSKYIKAKNFSFESRLLELRGVAWC